MIKPIFEDQYFSNLNFQEETLTIGEYDNCTFQNCIFANVDLMNVVFTECQFTDCDFSNAMIANTAFREVRFKSCKMLGLGFEHCNTFRLEMTFKGCQLNMSSFYQLNLPQIQFSHCNLENVDFANAHLAKASFNHCDLKSATFDNTNLEQADFRNAINYVIDPEMNKIKKAKFSKAGVFGLLKKYNIVVE